MPIDFKAFRSRTKMTQRDLADRLGCKQPMISAWEKNKNVPTLDTIEKLIDAGINAEELFGADRARKLLSHPPKEMSEKDLRDGVAIVVDEILRARGIIK